MNRVSFNRILIYVIIGILIIAGIKLLNIKLNEDGIGTATELIIDRERVSEEKENSAKDIVELTADKTVADYIKNNNRLPDYYMTKREAREKGWVPEKGNLCKVLPGKAIGGDHFGNREKRLPADKGRKYFEADVNYDCGRRNADRLVYSNDGLIFITKDHYKTFQQL